MIMMKHALIPIGVAMMAAFLAGCGGESKAESDPEFVERFKEAHTSAQLNELTDLVCWDGVTPEMRKPIERSYANLLSQPLASVTVIPPETGSTQPSKANLPIAGRLVIKFDVTHGITGQTLPFGIKDDKHYFTVVLPAQADAASFSGKSRRAVGGS